MRKYIHLLVLFLCTILCACSASGEVLHVVKIDESENSLQFVSPEVDSEILFKLLSMRPSIDELNSAIPLSFIKTTETGYTTIFQTEKGMVLVSFDAQQVYSHAQILRIAQGISEKEMDNIAIGSHLEDVMLIDPDGEYLFLYTSSSDVPLISQHLLENGVQYTFFYDEEFHIISIKRSIL